MPESFSSNLHISDWDKFIHLLCSEKGQINRIHVLLNIIGFHAHYMLIWLCISSKPIHVLVNHVHLGATRHEQW